MLTNFSPSPPLPSFSVSPSPSLSLSPSFPRQGQKLSRYSRQAKELLENGGPGLGEDDIVADVMMGPSHSKRPRLQHGGEGAMEMGEMAF